ncbi:14164_t:CDS:2 [Acaulospora morrowiae]|uniref:14164_t:CDS:1 n=1 Tax=Acaulospora morrowiae TaxID=94023 RepID=A0A9N9G5Y3_9GLOM|nr:14164_t:CDS:2 [Acaulospora morrowiae]
MGSSSSKSGRKKSFTDEDLLSTIDDGSIGEQFRYIQGRRFHNVLSAVYDLPNDDEEADRLHLEHFLIKAVWQSNFSSPIIRQLESNSDDNIVSLTIIEWDLCTGRREYYERCGSGSWSLEMSADYPNSKFVGLDISPIFPTRIKPNNLTFQKSNILEGINYRDGEFDFVHMRFMMPAFTQAQWEEIVIREIVRVLAVGGYLELCEYELCQNCGPVFEKLLSSRREMLRKMGINPDISQILGKFVDATSQFEQIHHDERIIPVGKTWAGKIGEVGKEDIHTRMLAIKPVLFPFMGITSEEYDEMMRKSILEFDEYKTFFVTCRWYAKKVHS